MDKPGYREQLADLHSRYDAGTISLADAAAYLRIDRRTLLADRTFPVIKAGRSYRVSLVALARWMTA